MAKRYSISGQNASAQAPPATAVQIAASTTMRAWIYDLLVGVGNVTPADQGMEIAAGRITALGTVGSTATPVPLDFNDVASQVTAASTGTANAASEPTYSSPFALDFGMNQRATFRWVAAPGGEIGTNQTATSGFAAKIHAATATFQTRMTVHWWE